MTMARLEKVLVLVLFSLVCLCLGADALAAESGIGAVAAHVKTNLSDIAKLITAGAYVAGMAFAVGAIVKFKAHKEQPQQVPIGTPIVLLFVAAGLLFAPSVFHVSGGTLFGSGQVGGISGTVSF